MGVGGCEIQIAGQIGMKFGTEVVIEGRKVLGGVDPVPPTPGDLEGPGPHVLLEPWSLTFKGSLLNQCRSACSK